MQDIASEELASFLAGKLTLLAFVLASIFKLSIASSIGMWPSSPLGSMRPHHSSPQKNPGLLRVSSSSTGEGWPGAAGRTLAYSGRRAEDGSERWRGGRRPRRASGEGRSREAVRRRKAKETAAIFGESREPGRW
uniref:Uncharacterized protein n=1 Tax=Arundo donax TaxID=35708 RepID=A0A0A9DE71_ARUDO